jgi:hypothetical protein
MRKLPKLDVGDLVEMAGVIYSDSHECGIIYGVDLLSRVDIENWYVVYWLNTDTTDVQPASKLRLLAKAVNCGKKNKSLKSLGSLMNWDTGKKV